MGPFSELTSALPWLLILVGATAYLLRRSYRRFGPSRDASPIAYVPRPGKGAAAQPSDPLAEIIRQEVHLHDAARELNARLDSKTSVLLHLVDRAEKQIQRLEALVGQLEGGNRSAADTSPEGPTAENDSPGSRTTRSSGDPLHSEIFELADQGYSEVTIAHRVGRRLGEVQDVLRARDGQ
ncbi:MAG: hypothetical protein WDZ59_06605 [Pirellulales bacterium]